MIAFPPVVGLKPTMWNMNGNFRHSQSLLLFHFQFIRSLALLSVGKKLHLLEDFVLCSVSPVYTAARLSALLRDDLRKQASHKWLMLRGRLLALVKGADVTAVVFPGVLINVVLRLPRLLCRWNMLVNTE